MKDAIKEIKQLLKTNKLLFVTEQVLKGIKKNDIEKVFISSNCKEEINEDLQNYAKIKEIECVFLKNSNKEIGIICKKPFSISVVGVFK